MLLLTSVHRSYSDTSTGIVGTETGAITEDFHQSLLPERKEKIRWKAIRRVKFWKGES